MHCEYCPFYWEVHTEDGSDWGCDIWGQEPPEEVEIPDDRDGYSGCAILVNEGKKITRLVDTVKGANWYLPEEEMDEKTKAEFEEAQEEMRKAMKEYNKYYPVLMDRLKKRAAKAWEKEKSND